MKIYKIQHNANYCLKIDETVCNRYFASEDAASELYYYIKERVNLAIGEHVQLEVINVDIIDGEYKATNSEMIRCFSEDTKFGN